MPSTPRHTPFVAPHTTEEPGQIAAVSRGSIFFSSRPGSEFLPPPVFPGEDILAEFVRGGC